MYKVLDLFSGIGGFSLGLERTGGFETVAFCEIEPFCQRVLAKHWPKVPCYDEVRTLTADRLAAYGVAVDVICGGFPCQDLSVAGAGAGLSGSRSGLWSEIARLVGELRPQYVIVENVSALLGRGLGNVLGDLATLGYDAEWHCIPASAIGAPHRRDRIWILAYPRCEGVYERRLVTDAPQESVRPRRMERDGLPERARCKAQTLADTFCSGQPRSGQSVLSGRTKTIIDRQTIDAFAGRVGQIWGAEPDVGRVANGISQRMDRLKGLGNAVVPQIPELIGRAIMAADA